MKIIKSLLLSLVFTIFLFSCGGLKIVNEPILISEEISVKSEEISDEVKKKWGHLDLLEDGVPGMSVERAYREIIKDEEGKTVVVAVIDSGIDIEHEDLDDVIWTNEDEVPNNGIDDDKNGYVDDIHGWNFLGKAYDEQLEMTRIIAKGTSTPGYEKAKRTYDKRYEESKSRFDYYQGVYDKMKQAHQTLSKFFDKEDYSAEEVGAIETEDEELKAAIESAEKVYRNDIASIPDAMKDLEGGVEYYSDMINYYLNPEFNGRTTGDDVEDLNDRKYGDGNVSQVEIGESHGTHVAGIIAAERNNDTGVKGVANNVEIMCLRVVPNGDEYDKDVALSIRYAVDNGAKVINGSFGKSFSPHSQWVRDAIAYAGKNDVVFVHAAGNDSKDIDVKHNFPADHDNNGPEVSNTYISVGALTPNYGEGIVAGFSNYGKNNVDLFSPGYQIYSSTPENEYHSYGGTSMAAPAVAGIAALIRSYFPKLPAAKVKQAILSSGLPLDIKVKVGGNPDDIRHFSELSKTGKIANAYNALIMASRLNK